MTLETWLILIAAAPLGIALLWYLLRPRPVDPALMQAVSDLRAAVDAQRERLGTLQGELKAELARQAGEQSRELSGFALEQTRLLVEGQAKLDSAMESRLAQDATAVQARLEEHRLGQAEQATALRRDLGDGRIALQELVTAEMTKARDLIERKSEEARTQVEARLKEMREANDTRLADIQKSVNEQLQSAVEKQMNESFARVIDQFTAVQKAMTDVQAVTSQIGDIKRIFSNVKTRGGWAEAQVKALLDDILPPGSYETNMRLSDKTAEAVEFAIAMPSRGGERCYMAVDAKFPTEDYERLITCAETGDSDGEQRARSALHRRIRDEAAKISSKYILPPRTVEFAVLYVPTEGLYAEIARVDGLLEELNRVHRILVLGPSLLPAMLRTIQLGYVTLSLGQKADVVREMLGATKAEMQKWDDILARLSKQVGSVGKTIEQAQVRTRAVARRLRTVESVPLDRVDELLGLEDDTPPVEVEEVGLEEP